MKQIAPKPRMLDDRMRIQRTPPARLTDRLTAIEDVLELSSMGIPDVGSQDWTLEIAGLVDCPTSISFEDLKRFPKRTVESVFVCSGDPRRPTIPLRRVANVRWGGADLAQILERASVRREATHLWSYGLDHGEFFGVPQQHYVKDAPLSRLKKGNVLIAYELNGEPLPRKHGFPARLVIPGFYGTNCVKWLCRLELRDRRATAFTTTRLYNEPDFVAHPSGKTTKPVWAVAPESIIVAPEAGSTITCSPTEIWGWAWSNCAVQSVEVSVDGGGRWATALLEPSAGLAWQRFSYAWQPWEPGSFGVHCRATDETGRTQSAEGARNSIHSIRVTVEGRAFDRKRPPD